MNNELEKWIQNTKNQKYIITLIMVIIVFILLTFYPNKNSKPNNIKIPTTKINSESNQEYETMLEKRLSNMLVKMRGVGSVSVMVTTSCNEEKVLAQDTTLDTQQSEEKDQQGGSRITQNKQSKQQVVMQGGSSPYVIKEYRPQIQGVFIVAEGANDETVEAQIIDAVSKVLNLPVEKISVKQRN